VVRLIGQADGWWRGQLLSWLAGGQASQSEDGLVASLVAEVDGWW